MIIEMKVIFGGILLGLAAGMMLLLQGKILGCSGILFGSWDFTTHRPNRDKLLFLAGFF
ncbi:transmembrane protein [Legionella sainthelensi]|uniref:Transmembrane protein n=3 Tax=Legionella sainthelensi TaxID=28087 RepID=A0A0W0YGL6_9GAMM|nr:transmembrane protein [Legionella sainthelensi]